MSTLAFAGTAIDRPSPSSRLVVANTLTGWSASASRSVSMTAATCCAKWLPEFSHTRRCSASFPARFCYYSARSIPLYIHDRQLAERPGRVLSREQIMQLVRGSADEAFDRSVDVHISRLRQKLGDDPKRPRLLKTIRGVGYLLTRDDPEVTAEYRRRFDAIAAIATPVSWLDRVIDDLVASVELVGVPG